MRNRYNLLGLMLLGIGFTPLLTAAPLPYTFTGDDCREVITTAQHRNQNWQRSDKGSSDNRDYYLRVYTTSYTDYNCWIAFDEVDFTAGKTYCVTIKGGVWYGLPSYTDRKGSFSVYYANATPGSSASTQTTSKPGTVTPVGSAIFSDPDYSIGCQNADFTTRKYYFKADATKTSRLALHVTSQGRCSYFCLSEFKIEECDGTVPAAPTAFSVTPDATGMKMASFAVTAPSKDVFSQPLTALDALTIYEAETPIFTVDNPTPGKEYTFTKEYGQVKTYSFRADATIGSNHGPDVTQYATIGTDLGNKGWESFSNYREADGPVGMRLTATATYVPGEGFKVTLAQMKRVEGAKYDFIRMPGNVKVGSDIENAEFVDTTVPADSRVTYFYNVIVKTEDTETTWRTNAISINNPIPYTVNFNDVGTDKNSYMEFMFYDNDGNNSTWSANSAGGMGSSGKDDYLVSPGVLLEKGKYYRLKSTMRGGYPSMAASLTTVETWYGKSNDLESLDIPLMPVTDIKERKENENYFTPPETGNYFFAVRHKVYTANANQLMVYDYSVEEVSPDLPGPVADAKVAYTGGSNARLSFTASPKSIAGLDQPSLTKIEILKDGELYKTLDNPVPGQEYTEDVTFTVGEQSIYSFVPYSTAGKGTSEDVLVMLLNTPYEQNFAASNSLDGFTVIDGGKDDHTWSLFNGYARSYAGGAETMDEWLVSPPVQLTQGQFYKVSADVACNGAYYDKNDLTRMSLYIGTSPTIESLSEAPVITDHQILANDPTGSDDVQHLWEYISVPETGQYFLAWRLVQDQKPCEIRLDNFKIDQGKAGTVPEAGLLEVVPDPDGGDFVTCHVLLPEKSMNGEPFTQNLYVRSAAIFMDDETSPTWTRTNITASESGFSVKIAGIETGKHKFTLQFGTGSNTNAPYLGREKEVYAFVGVNAPSHPEYFNAYQTENCGEVKFEWKAPATDVLGFPIQKRHVSYSIFELVPRVLPNEQVTYDEMEIVNGLKDVYSYTYQCLAADAPQQWKRFVIRATTSGGAAQPMLTSEPIAVGMPDALPYIESFKDLTASHLMQNKQIEDGSAMWGFNSKHPTYGATPVDNDGGLALMEALWGGSTSGLVTGNIKITGKAPRLSLYLYAGPENDELVTNGFNVQVLVDDQPWTIIDSDKPIHTWADGFARWQKMTLDLSPYVGKTVRLAFVGTAGSDQFTVMDHIVIDEDPDTDMAIKDIDVPDEGYTGQPLPVTVHYKNLGKHWKWEGNISLYRNGVKVAEKSIESPKGELATVQLFDTIDLAQLGNSESVVYQARIDDAADADLLDNVSVEKRVYIVDGSEFPAVINLAGQKSEQGVTLTWEAPSIPAEGQEVADDFEGYTSWSGIATGFGAYTLIDADCSGVSFIQGLDWPIEKGSLQSFFIADFSDPCFDEFKEQFKGTFEAHSGNKVAASFTNYDTETPVSDWLVSPALTGEAQTVTFWARVLTPTRSTVMGFATSSTGKSIADFNIREEDWTYDLDDQWRKFTYEVPAGTKYVAIYNYNCAGTMLMIDDFSYTPVGNEALTIQAYRVYRDGDLLNGNVAPSDAVLTFNDPTAKEDAIYRYEVSTLYHRGEGPSEVAIVSTSGLDSLSSSAPLAYGQVEEIVVRNADGLEVSVFTTDGVMLHSLDGADSLTIPAAPGIYVVTVGTSTYKVVVR